MDAGDSRALTTSQEHGKEEILHPGAALEREQQQQGWVMIQGQDRSFSSAHTRPLEPAGCPSGDAGVTVGAQCKASPRESPRLCSPVFGMWWLGLPGAAGAAQDLQPSPHALRCLMSTRAVKSPLLTPPGPAALMLPARRGGFISLRGPPPPLSVLMVTIVLSQACLEQGADSHPSLPPKT